MVDLDALKKFLKTLIKCGIALICDKLHIDYSSKSSKSQYIDLLKDYCESDEKVLQMLKCVSNRLQFSNFLRLHGLWNPNLTRLECELETKRVICDYSPSVRSTRILDRIGDGRSILDSDKRFISRSERNVLHDIIIDVHQFGSHDEQQILDDFSKDLMMSCGSKSYISKQWRHTLSSTLSHISDELRDFPDRSVCIREAEEKDETDFIIDDDGKLAERLADLSITFVTNPVEIVFLINDDFRKKISMNTFSTDS